MKLPQYIRHIIDRRALALLFLISIVLLILGLALIYVNVTSRELPLILHFDSFRGIDFFGSAQDLFDIAFIGIGAWCVNVLLAAALITREQVLSYVLAAGNAVVSLLVLIAIITIISVN